LRAVEIAKALGYVGHMQTANIATAKNQFSRLLEQVKQGESILITERNRPIARLEPLLAHAAALESLHADGVLTPPKSRLDLAAFLAMPAPGLSADCSLSRAVLAEREETR
jgi:prevent-host-death family protein